MNQADSRLAPYAPQTFEVNLLLHYTRLNELCLDAHV